MQETNDHYFYIPQIKRRNQKAAIFKSMTILAIIFSISFLIFFSCHFCESRNLFYFFKFYQNSPLLCVFTNKDFEFRLFVGDNTNKG